MPIMIPPVNPTGILRFKWIDPNGVVRQLSRDYSPNIFIPLGSTGLNYATFEVAAAKLPFSPASLITNISTVERELMIPIVIVEDSIEDLLSSAENLVDWFATGDENNRNPGIFQVTRPDDTIRQIEAYYIDGLQGDMSEGGVNWTKYVLKLFCPDPYPNDGTDITITKNGTELAAGIGVLNAGKLDAYPIWKIVGPWQDITITNETTNKSFTVTHTAAALDELYIDTRPSEFRSGPSTYDENGVIRLSWVDPTSEYFTLVPGVNVISWTSSTWDDDITYIELTYLQRYRTFLR